MRHGPDNAVLIAEIRRRLDRLADRRLRGEFGEGHQEEYRRLCEEEVRLLGPDRLEASAREGACFVAEERGLVETA
jgi:hypothetical protein